MLVFGGSVRTGRQRLVELLDNGGRLLEGVRLETHGELEQLRCKILRT